MACYVVEMPALAYAPEACAACAGIGHNGTAQCRACAGRGLALVHQPALKCPRCAGTGEVTPGFEYLYPHCIVCRGLGWAMVLSEINDGSLARG